MKAPTQSPAPSRKYWTAPPESGHRASPELAAACSLQMRACLEGASPQAVIALIEPLYETASARGQAELKAHLSDLYAFGDQWPTRESYGVWTMPEGSVPMTQPDYSPRQLFADDRYGQ